MTLSKDLRRRLEIALTSTKATEELIKELGSGGSSIELDNTGATDVTQDISDYLESNESIQLGQGTYVVGDLNVSGKKITGSGTLVKSFSAERTLILDSDSTVEGITFQSTTTGVQRAEIKLADGAENIKITNCTFKGSIYAAISADVNGADDSVLTYIDPASDIVITNCIFDGYTRPLYLHSVNNVVISNNVFKNTLRDAIRLRQNVGFCNITNNTFKNIGVRSEDVVERPKNWSSLESYTAGTRVSVPPFGIYEATAANTTIGDNPATNGASEWTLIDGAYFETKDAIDTFWSGKDLVISNNVIESTGSVGLDIKGSEPSGDYSTNNVVVTGNLIKDTFGIGINFHSADVLTVGDSAGEFRPVGNCIISDNIISRCNAERYDVSSAAINLRQGSSNVTVSNNNINNHYGRALNVTNLDQSSEIQRSIQIIGNQIVDCGIPGNAGNLSLNLSPVDGIIIKNNVIENTNLAKTYELVASGTVSSTNSLDISSRLTQSDLSVDLTGLSTIKEVLGALKTEMESKDFPDNPNPAVDVKYYDKVTVDGEQTADLRVQDLLFTAVDAGAAGNDLQIEIVEDNTIATGVNVGAVEVNGNLVTLTVRTSARMENVVNVWNANAGAAGATALMTLVKVPGTSTGIFDQPEIDPLAPTNLTGGADPDRVSFYTRIPDNFKDQVFPIVVDGLNIDLKENPHATNSVNRTGVFIRGEETVGSTTYSAGIAKMIISENIIRNNASQPRFEILYDGQELTTSLAYVISNNSENSTAVAPAVRTAFSGGADSDASLHLNTLASISVQEIQLQAREAGAAGNTIFFEIEQSTTPNQALTALIAPVTTVNGYEIGGREIKVILPADGAGDPVDASIADVEALLKRRLNQVIISSKDNILS